MSYEIFERVCHNKWILPSSHMNKHLDVNKKGLGLVHLDFKFCELNWECTQIILHLDQYLHYITTCKCPSTYQSWHIRVVAFSTCMHCVKFGPISFEFDKMMTLNTYNISSKHFVLVLHSNLAFINLSVKKMKALNCHIQDGLVFRISVLPLGFPLSRGLVVGILLFL